MAVADEVVDIETSLDRDMKDADFDVDDYDRSGIINSIFEVIDRYTFNTGPHYSEIYPTIRESLMRYSNHTLIGLYLSIKKKKITGIDHDQLSELDARLVQKIQEMRDSKSFQDATLDSLENNLKELQYNTLLIVCQKVETEVTDKEQKQMVGDLIDILTAKMQKLNWVHGDKRGDKGLIPNISREAWEAREGEAVSEGGAITVAKLNELLEAIGIHKDEFRNLFLRVGGMELDDNFQEILDALDDEVIDQVIQEIKYTGDNVAKAKIKEHVKALSEVDMALLTTMDEIGKADGNDELKGKFVPFVQELLKLQINIILLICQAFIKKVGIGKDLDDILDNLNKKFKTLNDLHHDKDIIMNGPLGEELAREGQVQPQQTGGVLYGGKQFRPTLPLAEPMRGGSRSSANHNDMQYKVKYLKYKAKYLGLRSKY
jgi:hypothetical protein